MQSVQKEIYQDVLREISNVEDCIVTLRIEGMLKEGKPSDINFNEIIDKLGAYYQEINDLLHKELSLEEAVFYMELPHRKYLANLQQTAQKHAVIVRDLGHHFVSLASKNPLPKEARK